MTPAVSAKPAQIPARAGELVVAFHPGADPVPDKGAKPGFGGFYPAAALKSSARPARLGLLEARLGLREARPLVPAASAATAAASSAAAPAGCWLLRFDSALDPADLARAFAAEPAVRFAEPNLLGALCYGPADPLYPQSRPDLDLIGLEAAWDRQRGSTQSVRVAVIDSGIDASHPELAGAIDFAASYNFPEHSVQVLDDIGHGTRVAGLIGAAEGNREGLAGVAFGCRLLSLDVANAEGQITVADVIAAVDWATAHRAQVINMSLAFSAYSLALDEACQRAANAGALLVAAAGNEGQGERAVYPACLESVLSVGAVLDDGRTRAPWSNFSGTQPNLVKLVAPGETLFSTIPGGQYNGSYGSGTSFAAPLVSGVAALLKAHNPTQSGAALRQHLFATARPLEGAFTPAGGAGHGLLDAQKALATPMRPVLKVAAVTIDDAVIYAAGNNGDGVWQKGETINLVLRLDNDCADAVNLTGTLGTADSLVTLSDSHGVWGDLPSGRQANPRDVFTRLTLAASSPAHAIPFTLSLAAGEGFSQTLRFEVLAESFVYPPAFIGSDTTWGRKSTWLVSAHTYVMPSARLTIEPGTTVRFASAGRLEVRGALDAQGTQDAPIQFTSLSGKPAEDPVNPAYPGLWLTSQASGNKLSYCNFSFAPVLDEAADTQFSDCLFDRTAGEYALKSVSGTRSLVRCTARGNAGGHGLVAGSKPLEGCVAEDNRGIGLQGGAMSDCLAARNGSIGLSSYRSGPFDWQTLLPSGAAAPAQALRCTAQNNGRTGIDVQNLAAMCVASGNGGRGIDARQVDDCTATENGADGIGGLAVSGCLARRNRGQGICVWGGDSANPEASAENSEARDNEGWGIEMPRLISGCTAVGNGQGGLKCQQQILYSLAAQNQGPGLAAGAMASACVALRNTGNGLERAAIVRHSWLIGNGQYGYFTPDAGLSTISRAQIEHCFIAGNHGPGVAKYATLHASTLRDNAGPGALDAIAMNGCNLYRNGGDSGHEYEESRPSWQLQQLDLAGNFWGTGTTALMDEHPWQSYYNIPAIVDFLDNNTLCEVKYDPHLAAESAAARPDSSAPAFLLAVNPTADQPLNIGQATFRLTFSKSMITAIPLSVTFGAQPPYTTNLIAPSPGWIDPNTWEGSFAIQSGMADGPQTLRVAGGIDVGGFTLPEDASHQFVIETSGDMPANNGLAIGQGTKMTVRWSEENRPPTAIGYNVQRSRTGLPGSFQKVNQALLTAPSFVDTGLEPETTYYYEIFVIDAGNNATQWTPPIVGRTGELQNGAHAWNGYR